MIELHDCLTEIGAPITDASFNSYIQSSLSLTPCYQPLFTTLITTAHETSKLITSTSLVWHLNEEANNVSIEANINWANATMMAAHAKGSGSGSGGSSRKGRDKDKSKGKKTRRKQCTNCKRTEHAKETCFSKGGGQENDVPDWWKEKQAAREKKESEKSANVASKDSAKDKDNNYALITIPADATFHVEDNKEFALVVTSRHDHQAYAVSTSTGVIVYCGTSSHFSPDRSKFLNYENIDPKPVKAADGHSFSVIDCAGCSFLIKDKNCIIRSPCSKCTIVGSIPLICGLYQMHPSTLINPPKPHHANAIDSPISINEFHHCLCHLNF